MSPGGSSPSTTTTTRRCSCSRARISSVSLASSRPTGRSARRCHFTRPPTRATSTRASVCSRTRPAETCSGCFVSTPRVARSTRTRSSSLDRSTPPSAPRSDAPATRSSSSFKIPAPGIISEVARIRDTGEVIDINQVQPNASILSSPRGVACSPSECAIVWSGTSSFGGSNAPEAWIARFPPGASPLTIKPEFLARGDPRGVVFDGQSFLAAFTRGNDLGVARADADGPRVGTGMINGDEFLAMAAVDGGALILTANTVNLGLLQPSAARLHVRNVLDEGGTEPGSSGAGGAGGGETTGEIVAGGGCGCELDARNDVGGWAIAVWCTLIAAGKRRQSKTRPRS